MYSADQEIKPGRAGTARLCSLITGASAEWIICRLIHTGLAVGVGLLQETSAGAASGKHSSLCDLGLLWEQWLDSNREHTESKESTEPEDRRNRQKTEACCLLWLSPKIHAVLLPPYSIRTQFQRKGNGFPSWYGNGNVLEAFVGPEILLWPFWEISSTASKLKESGQWKQKKTII